MDTLAEILTEVGHPISPDTVRKELVKLGFSRQYNRKADEGSKNPDRNAQFEHINAKVAAAQAKKQPVISGGTKKKELVGNFRNGGSDYRPKGQPRRVNVHDSEDKDLGKVVPYGVYDVTANTGFVSLGITSDTAEFAVEDIRFGIVYAFAHPGLRFVFILLAATSFLIRPVIELLPGISGQVFNAGPAGLSFLLAAIGVGAMTASLWLAPRGDTKGLTRLLVSSTSVTGIALMLAMAFPRLWVAATFLVIMGAAMLVGNVAAQTLVQNTVDSNFRSRVMSLFIVFAYGLPAVGAVIMGWVSSYAGFPRAIDGGALLMLVFWAWARPQQAATGALLEAHKAD